MSTRKGVNQSGEIIIPEDVKVTQEKNTIIVEGKNGKIVKDFTKVPDKTSF